jgi:hypothetical protein
MLMLMPMLCSCPRQIKQPFAPDSGLFESAIHEELSYLAQPEQARPRNPAPTAPRDLRRPARNRPPPPCCARSESSLRPLPGGVTRRRRALFARSTARPCTRRGALAARCRRRARSVGVRPASET